MSSVTNTRISWDQFTQLLTPTHPNKAETIFDSFKEEVETAVAIHSSKKKGSEPISSTGRDVLLALIVKNYIKRIDFGSLYSNGRVDVDKVNQITADRKKIAAVLHNIIMRLGTTESFGFVAEHVNNALTGRIYSLCSAEKARVESETSQRTAALANKLFLGPLIDTAHNKKTKDAAIEKRDAFVKWLMPVETRIAEVAFSIMKSKLQDDETQQDDRISPDIQAKHLDINFANLRNVPISIITDWIQINKEFIKPLAELEAKADKLRLPRNLLEWNNTYNTANEWVEDVKNKKLPQRERPTSIYLDIGSASTSTFNDPFLNSPTTPFKQPSSSEDGIPFKYFVSSFTVETLIELESQRRPIDIIFPKPSELVKQYVLGVLATEKRTLESTIENLCDDKDPLNEAAASIGVELESTATELSLRQKKFAQQTLLAQINKKIVKEVSAAFKMQKGALLAETKRDFETKFSEKGPSTSTEGLLFSLLRVQGKIIDIYVAIKSIEDFERALQMSKYFEDSILSPLYKESMAEGAMEIPRFTHWTGKVQRLDSEFLQS